MKFSKLPLNAEEQFIILTDRGLEFEEPKRFYSYIKTIGYYRLSGYMYPFQLADGTHRFKEKATFNFILDHYIFDKELRLVLLSEIERIEIAFRAIICNTFAIKHGAHWYLDSSHFNNQERYNKWILEISDYCKESSDLFIKNYIYKYSDPALPASWMVFEILTFGQLASLFENLKDNEEKKYVAKEFGIQVGILQSWLKSINYIRNCCAHHARLWNKKIPIKPLIPVRKSNRFLKIINDETNKRVYGIITCMLVLSIKISPGSNFKSNIKYLFEKYPKIQKSYMGFFPGWEDEPIWKD